MHLVTAVIKKCRKRDYDPKRPRSKQRWCLYDHKGKKLLGRHPSKKRALRQERAIQVRKHGSAFPDVRIVTAQPTPDVYAEWKKASAADKKKLKQLSARLGIPAWRLVQDALDIGVPLSRYSEELKNPNSVANLRESIEDEQSFYGEAIRDYDLSAPTKKDETWRTILKQRSEQRRKKNVRAPKPIARKGPISEKFLKSLRNSTWEGYDFLIDGLSQAERKGIASVAWLLDVPAWRVLYEMMYEHSHPHDYLRSLFEGEDKGLHHDALVATVGKERQALGDAYPDLSLRELVSRAESKRDKDETRKIRNVKKAPKIPKTLDKSQRKNLWFLQHRSPGPQEGVPRRDPRSDQPGEVSQEKFSPLQQALISKVVPIDLTGQQEVAFDSDLRRRKLGERIWFLETRLGFDHYFQKPTVEFDDIEFALPYLQALSRAEAQLPTRAHVVKFKGAYYHPLGSLPFYPFETEQRIDMATEKHPEMVKYAGHVYVLAADDEEPKEDELEAEVEDDVDGEHAEEEAAELDLLEELRKHWQTILDKMPDDMPVDDDFEVALNGIDGVIAEMDKLHAEYAASMEDMEEAERDEKEEDED